MLDLTKVQIATNEDYVTDSFQHLLEDLSFDRILSYVSSLKKMNVVVGFGRGFWSGVKQYSYIVYFSDKRKFYWFVKDYNGENVSFYQIKDDSEILNLLATTQIENNFSVYDNVISFNLIFSMIERDFKGLSGGEYENSFTSIEELFGLAEKEFEEILLDFNPASRGSKYPHTEFERLFLKPKLLEIKNNL